MDLGLKNKTVVITGGSSGIGKAVALAFAEEGCNVAVCGRTEKKLENLRDSFDQKGYTLFSESVDVTHINQIENFAESVEARFGKIDIWVNNAGAINPMPFEELTEDQWDFVVNTNFKAVYFGSAIASQYMKKTTGGVIINTSSFTALVPTAGKALYSATKAAIENLTRTLSVELACYNIRVVSVIPGYTRTEFTADNIARNHDMLVSSIGLNRLADPSDLVGAYLFLASDAASYISGIGLPVAGAKLCTQNPLWGWQRLEDEKRNG